MWPQRTLCRSVSIFVASVAALTPLAYAQDGKNAPLPVAYTSLGDTLVLQGQGADRPWVRLIGVGTPDCTFPELSASCDSAHEALNEPADFSAQAPY